MLYSLVNPTAHKVLVAVRSHWENNSNAERSNFPLPPRRMVDEPAQKTFLAPTESSRKIRAILPGSHPFIDAVEWAAALRRAKTEHPRQTSKGQAAKETHCDPHHDLAVNKTSSSWSERLKFFSDRIHGILHIVFLSSSALISQRPAEVTR